MDRIIFRHHWPLTCTNTGFYCCQRSFGCHGLCFDLRASILGMGCQDVEGNGKWKGSGFYVGGPNQTMDLNQLNAMLFFLQKHIVSAYNK